mmetsp:Transcript_4975/g.12161  ORF Transcript_4975/g.12161 Transcript_4975/m.12161 type:complete len:205 (-) Transcript_4975:14-628(-)
MIQANKGSVITSFHQQTLDIRQYELDYFLMVFDRMSSIAALLGSFASSAMFITIPKWVNPIVVALFLTFAGCAVGLNLIVILIASLSAMWGPGQALRGDDAKHMHMAIETLEAAQQIAMRYFVFGLFCYFGSSIMVTWVLFDIVQAVLITFILITFLFALFRQSMVIRRAFITTLPFTTGLLRGNPVRSPDEIGQGTGTGGTRR